MRLPTKAQNYHRTQNTRDSYGGYTDLSFEAKGYFYLHKDKRWWFVDPEGNAFLSFGINHIERHRVLHTYNRNHWANRFGISPDSDPKDFFPGLQEKVKADVALVGLNTLGCHTDHEWYTDRFIPYVMQVRFVDICHYMQPEKEEFHDVFDPSYRDHCRKIVQEKVLPPNPIWG
jgi:hypothetical protein